MIHDLSMQLVSAWHDTSWIELIAAALAVAYLLLAIGQHLSCWLAAFISSVLYVWVLFTARLYMESVLNAFYAAMAVYGFWQWQHGKGGGALAVNRWPIARHALAALGIVALSLVSSFFLRRYTPAALPFPDSMVTWASVFATFLVARKVYENWHWWLADRFGQRVPVLHAAFVRNDAALWAVPHFDRDRHARMAPQFAR